MNVETRLTAEIPSIIEAGSRMVDTAIVVLSKGWQGMSEAEREKFLRFYDPGDTGDVDAEFVQSVQRNFERIDRKLASELAVEFAEDSKMCVGMRLYYTEFIKVHVCPYIEVEINQTRMARDLVHEVAHMALLVVDRAYYHDDYTPYQELTPRGHWTAQLPVVGHLLREIARADTEFHPDAYAKFAAALLDSQAEDEQEHAPVYDNIELDAEIDPADARFLSR
jgi:hypothetical protein